MCACAVGKNSVRKKISLPGPGRLCIGSSTVDKFRTVARWGVVSFREWYHFSVVTITLIDSAHFSVHLRGLIAH